MSSVNSKLQGPLRSIAKWAFGHEMTGMHMNDDDADLLDLRRHIGRNTAEAITAFLRTEVEKASKGERSVRPCPSLAKRFGSNSVGCVVVPFGTPEGEVKSVGQHMFGFVVAGANPGYLTPV